MLIASKRILNVRAQFVSDVIMDVCVTDSWFVPKRCLQLNSGLVTEILPTALYTFIIMELITPLPLLGLKFKFTVFRQLILL